MIVVLKGGTSAERQVSLWTAESMTAALQSLGEVFIEVDQSSPDWLDQVQQAAPRCVLIALHGPQGEDGNVQHELETRGIPYVGSGVAASALAIDKQKSKARAATLGIATPRGLLISTVAEWPYGLPAVVKPNADGSSYGVTIAHTPEELDKGITEALKYGREILVEEYIQGKEIAAGLIDTQGALQALPLVEIRPHSEFFDFQSKYNESGAEELCPAPLEETITHIIQEQSRAIYQAFGFRHYARLDWILRDETAYFLEANTLPGMTKTSLLPKELVAAGIGYEAFIAGLIAAAV